MVWTEDLDRRLRELLVGEKLSVREAAVALSAEFRVKISRNSAMGRASRIGIRGASNLTTHRPSGPRRPKQKIAVGSKDVSVAMITSAATSSRATVVTPVSLPKVSITAISGPAMPCAPTGWARPEGGNVRLFDARPGMCRWVVSDVCGGDTMFCGAWTGEVTKSYCAEHHALVYVKPTAKDQKRLRDAARRYTASGKYRISSVFGAS